jgi:DNA-binding SARP family transcriptional activator
MIAAPPRLRARMLGPFRVEIGERVINRWERPSARRLVQYLLLANAHTAPREQLMEALSPGLDRERAANALAKSLSIARSALGEHVVEASRSFVRLAIPVETDLAIAIAALERATAKGPGRRAALEDALALEGELLPEEPWADWADAARVRLADLRRAATIELARATANWAPVFHADPACEEAALAVIEAHSRAGQRELAVRAYQRHRDIINRELGVAVSLEIEAAYRQVLAGEPSIAEPPDDEAAYARLLEEAIDDEERAAAWVGLAATAYRRGDMAGVIDTCRLALDSTGGGASPGRGRLLAELGWAEVRAGRPNHGRPHLEQAAEILRANSGKDPELLARVLDRLAVARSDCGDHAAGLEVMEEAFARAPRTYRRLGAILRLHRGRLLGRVDRPEEGLGDVFAARRVLTALGDVYSISVSHWVAAELLDQLGLFGRALAEREAEVRLVEPIDNPRNLAGALVHGSRLLSRLGRAHEAAAWANRGLDAALATGDPRLVAWAREEVGKVSGNAGV